MEKACCITHFKHAPSVDQHAGLFVGDLNFADFYTSKPL